ncbi:hypothetical protein pb186bvf_007886 [Paramecium bursaria]
MMTYIIIKDKQRHPLTDIMYFIILLFISPIVAESANSVKLEVFLKNEQTTQNKQNMQP